MSIKNLSSQKFLTYNVFTGTIGYTSEGDLCNRTFEVGVSGNQNFGLINQIKFPYSIFNGDLYLNGFEGKPVAFSPNSLISQLEFRNAYNLKDNSPITSWHSIAIYHYQLKKYLKDDGEGGVAFDTPNINSSLDMITDSSYMWNFNPDGAAKLGQVNIRPQTTSKNPNHIYGMAMAWQTTGPSIGPAINTQPLESTFSNGIAQQFNLIKLSSGNFLIESFASPGYYLRFIGGNFTLELLLEDDETFYFFIRPAEGKSGVYFISPLNLPNGHCMANAVPSTGLGTTLGQVLLEPYASPFTFLTITGV